MNYSVQEYNRLPSFELPRKLDTGFTITELKGQCTKCDRLLVDIRGEVTEHPTCSEVRFAGLCHPCKMLVTCQFRYYRDGHVIERRGETWQGMEVSPVRHGFSALLSRLRKLVRKISG